MRDLRRTLPLVLLCLLSLTACGGGGPKPKPDALAQRGMELYKDKSCFSCHLVDGTKLVGPTWKGLYGSQVTLDDGTTVVADDAYLRESMLQPSAKTVKDFPKGLMETVIKPNSLKPEEVDALVAYIKTLK